MTTWTRRQLLATAAEKGQLAVARFLLDHGADPKSAASQMGTALHYAALAGHKAIVELLLERGAPVDAAPASRVTALNLAALQGFRSIAEVLLDTLLQEQAGVTFSLGGGGGIWVNPDDRVGRGMGWQA